MTRHVALLIVLCLPRIAQSAGQQLHIVMAQPSGPTWYVAAGSDGQAVEIVARKMHPCSAIEHHRILQAVGLNQYTVRIPGSGEWCLRTAQYRPEAKIADFGPLTEPPTVKTAAEWAAGKPRIVFFDRWTMDRNLPPGER